MSKLLSIFLAQVAMHIYLICNMLACSVIASRSQCLGIIENGQRFLVLQHAHPVLRFGMLVNKTLQVLLLCHVLLALQEYTCVGSPAKREFLIQARHAVLLNSNRGPL